MQPWLQQACELVILVLPRFPLPFPPINPLPPSASCSVCGIPSHEWAYTPSGKIQREDGSLHWLHQLNPQCR